MPDVITPLIIAIAGGGATALGVGAAGAAAIGLGAGSLVSASQAPGIPDVPPPPPPANYFSYDADGNVMFSQVWDAERNAYISTPAPLTQEQEQDKAARAELRTRMLANLNETPEDRIRAYDEYAQTFSEVLHKNVDEQFAKIQASNEADLERRGLTGSKAEVDKFKALVGAQGEAAVDIAQRSELAKEDLATRDRNYWLNLLKYTDTQASQEELKSLRRSGQASQIAVQGTAAERARYTAETSNIWDKFGIETEKRGALTKALASGAGSLGYQALYSGGKSPLQTKKPSSGVIKTPTKPFGKDFSTSIVSKYY